MKRLLRIYWSLMMIATLLLTMSSAYILWKYYLSEDNIEEKEQTQGLMLLIEFEGTEGLENFAYEMKERDIPGLLMVNAEFVENNCSVVKKLNENNIEIAGLYPSKPLWDVDYDTQYEVMEDTKQRVEACIGKPMNVFGSKYFAYDENTVKAAEELGIEYVLARGTTKARATIYKPTEYDVKIFSVSNVGSEKWGTGSLCDYSYWAREGEPEDFKQELMDAYNEHDKISPVSHTYIGGLKERWNNIYTYFFDNTDVNWVTFDTFGEVDKELAFSEIPDNREVQYTTPKPATPLSEEPDVFNPCAIEDNTVQDEANNNDSVNTDIPVVMFHNGTGPMCLEAIAFFKEKNIEYTEYLTTDDDFSTNLNKYKDKVNDVSEGVSTAFGYYPMIFINDKAYSGFNDDIQTSILEDLSI